MFIIGFSAKQSCRTSPGVPPSELVGGALFAARVAVINVEVTRFLKRVRKVSGARLRYCLVFEAHKSGFRTCTLLCMKLPASSGIATYAPRGAGVSSAKLCDRTAASYVAKYLEKREREGSSVRALRFKRPRP